MSVTERNIDAENASETLNVLLQSMWNKIYVLEKENQVFKQENEVFKQENEVFKQENVKLRQENQALKEEIKALQVKLNKNSKNSNKPSSLNPFVKTKSMREPSGKKSGGQKNHPGKTLLARENPDQVEDRYPVICECCSKPLDPSQSISMEERQVFEPIILLWCTAYRAHVCRCSCGHITKASFPQDVRAKVQYGPTFKGLAVDLLHNQFVPWRRCSEFLKNLFGMGPAEGTLALWLKEASDSLENWERIARLVFLKRPVVCLDETGMRIKAKAFWCHIACTEDLTLYSISHNRGHEGFQALNVLPGFRNTVVHDCMIAYFSDRYFATHALCNAHLLRELQALIDHYKKRWASEMKALLQEACHEVNLAKEAGKSHLSPDRLEAYVKRYEAILALGIREEPVIPVGKSAKTTAQNLLIRFRDYQKEVLLFLFDFNVPFTNNLAERAARMVKVQQKVSGAFRSEEGAQRFALIRSYSHTLKKQGENVFQGLVRLFNGKIIYPNIVKTPS